MILLSFSFSRQRFSILFSAFSQEQYSTLCSVISVSLTSLSSQNQTASTFSSLSRDDGEYVCRKNRLPASLVFSFSHRKQSSHESAVVSTCTSSFLGDSAFSLPCQSTHEVAPLPSYAALIVYPRSSGMRPSCSPFAMALFSISMQSLSKGAVNVSCLTSGCSSCSSTLQRGPI